MRPALARSFSSATLSERFFLASSTIFPAVELGHIPHAPHPRTVLHVLRDGGGRVGAPWAERILQEDETSPLPLPVPPLPFCSPEGMSEAAEALAPDLDISTRASNSPADTLQTLLLLLFIPLLLAFPPPLLHFAGP
eukprot:747336-Hanusia_phi.AAC.1